MSRAGGQPGRPPGVVRGDRHHPRSRPADPDRHLAAAAGNVTAPQRHHHGQRRGPLRQVALGSGESGQLSTLGRRIRRGRFPPANGVARCPGSPCTGIASRYTATPACRPRRVMTW